MEHHVFAPTSSNFKTLHAPHKLRADRQSHEMQRLRKGNAGQGWLWQIAILSLQVMKQ
jgi:hypothetical protein